jgi:predicted amino acid racemase
VDEKEAIIWLIPRHGIQTEVQLLQTRIRPQTMEILKAADIVVISDKSMLRQWRAHKTII